MLAAASGLIQGWRPACVCLVCPPAPHCSQTALTAAARQVPIKHRRQMLARGGLDFGHLVNLSCKYAETHLKGSLLDRKQIGSLRCAGLGSCGETEDSPRDVREEKQGE